ncbi:hypothetical protein GHT09_012051 [Marmota monax]|uniref:KRAB domain-containing protein n=1 Tax=Marmota monax TaxID=9995 RepID=A0A834PNA7_MARMO|nr:hypothetical protein GHT09_012051 [Marmota monax]
MGGHGHPTGATQACRRDLIRSVFTPFQGLVTVTSMAMDFSRQPDPAQRTFCKDVLWEEQSGQESVGKASLSRPGLSAEPRCTHRGGSSEVLPGLRPWLCGNESLSLEGHSVTTPSLAPHAGRGVSKPDVASFLEQEEEPWRVPRELAAGLFSGQQSVHETQELFPKQDLCADGVIDRTSSAKLEGSTFRENWASECVCEGKLAHHETVTHDQAPPKEREHLYNKPRRWFHLNSSEERVHSCDSGVPAISQESRPLARTPTVPALTV